LSSNVGGCGGARLVAFEPASGQLTSRSAVGSGGGGLPLVAAPLAAIAADAVRRLAVVDGEIVNRPYYGYFPMRYFSEYEYGATLTQ